MFRFILFMTFVVEIMVLTLDDGSDLLQDPIPYLIDVTKDYQAIQIDNYNEIGYVAVPFDLLCSKSTISPCLLCLLCLHDCLEAHNAYGGRCESNNLVKGGKTCRCANSAKEAEDLKMSPDPKKNCGCDSLDIQDTLFKTGLRLRTENLLCGGGSDTSACDADCRANHGNKNGTCVYSEPNVKVFGTYKRLYCKCY